MPCYSSESDKKIREMIFAKDDTAQKALYDNYSSLIFGQFVIFCRSAQKAEELTATVLETAFIELSTGVRVNGKLIVWLMKLVRKVARMYLIDYSVKKSEEHKCIKRLVLSEGFSIVEAANLLGICEKEAILKLREKLKA